MKLFKTLTGVGLMTLVLASCEEKMDYNEYTAYDQEYIQRSFSYVGGFMAKIYNDIDSDWGNNSGAMLASATDESVYSHDGNTIEDFYNGNWSASNPHQTIWSSAYEGITYCNEVLDNWTNLQFEQFALNKDYEQQMFLYNNYQYEARWARAYFYYTLVRQYGGVPFKTHNTTGEEETALPRTSADEIFQFIISECDDIKDKIIADYTNIGDMALYKPQTGRASKFAVEALKAQAALYQASPLFTQGKSEAEKAALWRAAAEANRELILDAEAGGKGLAVSLDTLWNISYISDPQCYKEILFARRTAAANTFESYNFPVGYSSGQGGNCPTQDFVDAFDCTDGLPITESPLYDPQNPYANRDPRLEMTVAHNGDLWPNDLARYNSTYPTLQTYVGGYHSRTGSSAGASYATPTGYYLKKFCNPSQILRARSGYAVSTSPHGWLTFRMGGMYLNYAEAVFQYFKAIGRADAADATGEGFNYSARYLASLTRKRSGMPEFPTGMSNDEFWTRYKRERQVELAFEGHRFYDVRRWMDNAETSKVMNVHAMEIVQNISEANDTTYTYTVKPITRGNGQWDAKWNLFPFSQTEIMKSGGAIIQNEGW